MPLSSAASCSLVRSKTSQVIAMLKRKSGTTLEEIMTAMGWQKHTTGHAECRRRADEEARAGHNQRQGWRQADLFHQRLTQIIIVLSLPPD
jgi:NAD(P)H-nitrite reductase large subunit